MWEARPAPEDFFTKISKGDITARPETKPFDVSNAGQGDSPIRETILLAHTVSLTHFSPRGHSPDFLIF